MNRLLLRIAVRGDLRFISHRDALRMLIRALVRSGLPLAYSRGFNPHPRISLLLPRAVGMSADDDPCLIELAEGTSPARAQELLAAQLPGGAELPSVSSWSNAGKPRLAAAHYEITLDDDRLPELVPAIQLFNMASEVLPSPVDEEGRSRSPMNIRPYVQDLRLKAPGLRLTTRFEQDRSVALRDLLPALGLSWEQLRHKIHRRKVECN